MSFLSGKKRPRSDDVISDLLTQNETAIESMRHAIDKCSIEEACSSLLDLKSIQSSALAKLREANTGLEETRSQLNKQSILFRSLEYEEAHLQQQLSRQVPTPHLERMCREETQHSTTNENVEENMNEFLCGNKASSFQDPSNYQKVITKLHQEINLRGSLERDALQANKALATKTASLQQNEEFLASLPKKLLQLEKSSLPLQSFFHTQHETRIGTERTKRLQLAKSLSAPLYTLFVQLQSYLDACKEEGMTVEIVTHKLSPQADDDTAAWFQPDKHVVHLCMMLADSKSKKVTIEFAYLPKLKVVTAHASSSGGMLAAAQDVATTAALLVNLFSGDKGEMVWSADSVHLKDIASTQMSGRPYHWCNYLAGIHLPATTRDVLDPVSTKAIVTQLKRRLDANTTLTMILGALKKKSNPIPTHASWKDPSDSLAPVTTKLVGWTLEDEDKEHVKTFAATLKHKSQSIKATVTVDYSLYPSVPPTWSLTTGGESWGEEHGSTHALESATNPLYDNALGQMERIINIQLDELVNPKEQETYNWILAHQLHRFVCLWDEMQGEHSSAAGQLPRSVKGKDRVPSKS
jgi:hypothetical protein